MGDYSNYISVLEDSKLFDSHWYVEKYKDVLKSEIMPEVHYLKFGSKMGRDPSPDFNGIKYAEVNELNNANPLIHFLTGKRVEFNYGVLYENGVAISESGEEGSCENKVIIDLLERAGKIKSDKCLDSTILRNGSYNGREILAYRATKGKYTYEEIVRVIENAHLKFAHKDVSQLVLASDSSWLIRLVRVVAAQQFDEYDVYFSLKLGMAIFEYASQDGISKSDAKFLMQLAISLNDFVSLEKIRSKITMVYSDRALIELDVSNPTLNEANEFKKHEWLKRLNKLWFSNLEKIGLPAILDQKYAIFDQIQCKLNDRVNGDLVTVVVSSYNPEPEQLITSVKSIINQSWKNLEILVVDDASTNDSYDIYKKIESMDDRLKIIYVDKNSGTYNARNVALGLAKGKFVTFQDVDDWSHPRRIEKQVDFLLSDKEKIACISFGLKSYENLIFSMPGRPNLQPNSSSLMFYRHRVVSNIGFFDLVRKGGDTEYILRIKAFFGDSSFGELEKIPLALIRLNQGSLSRSEFKLGWRHRARSIYKESYQYWHSQAKQLNKSMYVDSTGNRDNVYCPMSFKVEKRQLAYDVILVGEWRQYGGPQKSMIEEIKALKKHNKKVAICQMEAFRFLSTEHKPKCEAIQYLINSGLVDEVNFDDHLEAEKVILRYPLLLQFTPNGKCNWNISEGIILANQAPHEVNGEDYRYFLSDCIRNSKHLFGIDFSWAPMGPQVRKAIEGKIPMSLLINDIPGIVDIDEWLIQKDKFIDNLPVIGRYSRDNILKYPDSKAMLLSAYPSSGCKVKIMGGVNSCNEILENRIPANWEVIPYGAKDVKDFLAEIDFFVYFDNSNIVEAFGRSILEAIASGVLVILHPKFKQAFGDLALYSKEENVKELMLEYYDLSKYRARQKLVVDKLKITFSYESYIKVLFGDEL